MCMSVDSGMGDGQSGENTHFRSSLHVLRSKKHFHFDDEKYPKALSDILFK